MDTYLLDHPVHGPGVEHLAIWLHATPRAMADPHMARLLTDRILDRLDRAGTQAGYTALTPPDVVLIDGTISADLAARNIVELWAETTVLDRWWPGRPWPTPDLFPRTTRLLARIRRTRIRH